MFISIIVQLVLIALNAVFACAEIAVISVNSTKLEKMAADGNRRAKSLQKLTNVPSKFLSTIQVAITLAGFLGSAFAADNFANYIVKGFQAIPVFSGANWNVLRTVSVIITTLLLSFITIIFGELVPKRVAMRKSEKVALGMAGFLRFVSVIFAPIVGLLTICTNGVLKLIKIDPNAVDEEVTEENIRMMVDAGSESGAIEEEEKEIIQNVFEFNDITAGEIATHRTELVMLWLEDDVEAWKQTIYDSDHTFYPICEDTVDNVCGVLNSKIYFRLEDKSKDSILKNAVRPAYFVPESIAADDLLNRMKTNKEKVAIVVDEFGGTHGIIAINDLVEKIIGDLDTDAEEIDEVAQIEEDTYRVLGSADIEKLEEIAPVNVETEFTTIGGWVTELFGDLPKDGDSLDYEDLNITVSAADNKRVHELIIKVNHPDTEEE